MRTRLTSEQRAVRREARQKIVDAANVQRRFSGLARPTLTMRHIQHAVRICRANELVAPEVYEIAGFRA